MGCEYSTLSLASTSLNNTLCFQTDSFSFSKSKSNFKGFSFNPIKKTLPQLNLSKPSFHFKMSQSSVTPLVTVNYGKSDAMETAKEEVAQKLIVNPHSIDEKLLQKMIYDGLTWSSLHGLLVGTKSVQQSGSVPGIGLVHAPFSLLPMPFPESHWSQACELAPIFNELFDRVSLDAKFLHDSLSRTRKVDTFTSRLLEIHSRMVELNKKEDIRLALHRSDYMLDSQTGSLLQIEFNTISSSFSGLSPLVTELHRNMLKNYGTHLDLDPNMVPQNRANCQFAEAMAKAWQAFGNARAIILFVVQPEERNMYDQHWLSSTLRDRCGVATVRTTLGQIDAEAVLLPDGTLLVNGEIVALVYFRAGYAPTDYPSESEWAARLLIEQSSAIKCPSIAYHLAGTKKIQQELAKPNILERFLDNKDEIAKVKKCFAGLWSLDDSAIIEDAIQRPELYVMKPQREGGGNNIYGTDVKEHLLRLKKEGSEENAAYILMQRIFPAEGPACLIREGHCYKDHAISELGIYGAYLRNKEMVILNEQCGYLMRTKVSSSNEGGVAAGFAVLDSLYLT